MGGAMAESEYKIDCNHQLDRWLQNMPHHLSRWLGYSRQDGATTDRRPLEAKSTESLPSREVFWGRRPPGAVSSASSRNVSSLRAPPAMTSREVSRGRASTSSTMSREVSRGRVISVTSVHYIFISDCLTTEQNKAARESLNYCTQFNKVPTLAIINKAIKENPVLTIRSFPQ